MRKKLRTLEVATKWLELAAEFKERSNAAEWDAYNTYPCVTFSNLRDAKISDCNRLRAASEYCYNRYTKTISTL
jgi:hypothetical protein